MGLVVGILTIVATLIYLAYEFNKETPGCVTMVLVVVGAYVVPEFIFNAIARSDPNLGIGLQVAHHLILVFLVIRSMLPSQVEKDVCSAADFEKRLWDEVNAMPPPSEETLTQIKIRYKLPTLDRYKETTDKTALQYWRNGQFNELMRKHRYGLFEK